MSKATKRERQKENRERAREERERLLKRDRRTKAVRNLLILLAPIAIIAIIVSATGGSDNKPQTTIATIATSQGTIVASLDTKHAPIATKRFIALADKHYYDGLCIDRLAVDFVIQGGSPKCDQQGGEGHSVVGEVPKDHYPLGSLAAAKSGSEAAGTFDAQFFVVTGSKGTTLPNDYARFGTVIKGLDIAQKIEKLPITGGATDGKPITKITIIRVRISKVDTSSLPTTTSSTTATTATTAPAASSTTASTAATTTSTTAPVSSSTTASTTTSSTSSSTTTTTTKP